MRQMSQHALEELGRTLAEREIAPWRVDRVRVESDDQVGAPVYYFVFGLEPGSAEMHDIDKITKLGLALRHELDERDDDTFPSVRVLSAKDWEQLYGA